MNLYQPISCSFYDLLLETSTLKTEITLIIEKENNTKMSLTTKILDVFTKKGQEFIKTESEDIIRLDRIISLNDTINNNLSCRVI